MIGLLAGVWLLGAPGRAAELPDPLVAQDGTRIETAAQWRDRRRPGLLEQFAREMYGRSPQRPAAMTFETFDRDPAALGGKALRLQIAIRPAGPEGPELDLLVYLPAKAAGPTPVFLGLNFWGNQAVHADPGIRLARGWMEEGKNPYVDLSGVKDHRATEATRGINARQWPLERMLERGYGFATIHREDIASDHDHQMTSGVLALEPALQQREDNFATIAAWAWGLSRGLDALERVPEVDASKVAVFGWSRLGKAALWAGATDPRFAMVISNESGAGGAKLFRRGVGEDIARLNTVFPHWYARSFRAYNGRDRELPFDQHELLALIAPRPLYVASAIDDRHADPEGEFLAAKAAEPVFRLLGAEGLPADQWPELGRSVQGGIGYHVRRGGHDVTDFDWEQYLTFADRHWRKVQEGK